MIQEHSQISKPLETPPYDYNLRFTTELSESSSTQLSNGILKDYINPHILFPQNINKASDAQKSRDSIATRIASKGYLNSDLSSLEGDPDYENLLELKAMEKAMEMMPIISGTSSKASVTQREAIGAGGIKLEESFEKEHDRFKQKFLEFFSRRPKSPRRHKKMNHHTSQHNLSHSQSKLNITPKGKMKHHTILPVDQHGDTEPTQYPFFKNGQPPHESFAASLANKLTAENNHQTNSFKALKILKKPAVEKQDENREMMVDLDKKKNSVVGGIFPNLNISSESASKVMTKENSKEDIHTKMQRKHSMSIEKVNRKLVLRDHNKSQENASHLSVHSILMQNNSTVIQRFNEIVKDNSVVDLKKYMKPYECDESSVRVKTLQDTPQKVNRIKIRSSSGKKKPISSHQSSIKQRERESHSFIQDTNTSYTAGLKRKKTLGYEPPMSEFKLNTRSTSQELFNQMRSKDSFILKHDLIIDTDSEGRVKTDEDQAGGSGTGASFDSITGFECFQTLPTKPDTKKPAKGRGESPMRYINPNRSRSYLGQILKTEEPSYVVTEANTSLTMYKKARKIKPMKMLFDNSRLESRVNTGWENTTIDDYYHSESKKSLKKLNLSSVVSHNKLDSSLVQSRRHTRVLKTRPDESYLIKPSLMGKAHRVILDANKLNNLIQQQQPTSKPRKTLTKKGNDSFASYSEQLKLASNHSFLDHHAGSSIKSKQIQNKRLRK